MWSHGSTGGITPISLRSPSANKARTTQPTHMLMIEALRLCRRIAASIISWHSLRVTKWSGLICSILCAIKRWFSKYFVKGIWLPRCNSTGSFVKHIVCITRLFESFLDPHPIFIGVLIHFASFNYILAIIVSSLNLSTMCWFQKSVEEIVKSE